MSHRFGGDWTEEKLEMLQKYLHAYTTALSKQSWCQGIGFLCVVDLVMPEEPRA